MTVVVGLLPVLLFAGPLRAQYQYPGGIPYSGGVHPDQHPLLPYAGPLGPTVLDPNAQAGQGYLANGYIITPGQYVQGRSGELRGPGGYGPGGYGQGGPGQGNCPGGCGQGGQGGQSDAPKSCLHRLYDRITGECCQGTHNDYGCGSWKADCVFIFGSCRAFWGEPCRKAPPKAYENWPGIFKP
jgi:hypothetical protein